LTNELKRKVQPDHSTATTWWRAMEDDEFTYLETHLVPKELPSGQFLSPTPTYSTGYMTNKHKNDFLVSFTYFDGGTSLVKGIEKQFAAMPQTLKNAWEKSAGVKERTSNLNNNKWKVNFKGEAGVMSIGIGETGKNPFFAVVFNDLIATGLIKWRLERILARSYRVNLENAV